MWLWEFTWAEIKTKYLGKSHFFSGSIYQVAVLMSFNHKEVLTFSDIESNTELPEKALFGILTVFFYFFLLRVVLGQI